MYYYRARYYSPELQRFISEDPIGFAGGDVNLYSYVWNSPVNRIVPLGLYDRDVHYDLTYRLAIEAGFTKGDAMTIAKGNQDTDEFIFDAWYWPFGGIQKHFMPYDYAIDNLNYAIKYKSLWYFGQSLHILQDTYSHAGYKWYSWVIYGTVQHLINSASTANEIEL